MNDWGWNCECGHWLSESDGEPVFSSSQSGSKQCCSQACANVYNDEADLKWRAQPCNARDGNLGSMGNSGKCNIVDESVHRARCTTCNKVGWYSERGRKAEEQGTDIFNIK